MKQFFWCLFKFGGSSRLDQGESGVKWSMERIVEQSMESREEQSSVEQSRVEQSRVKQSRAEQRRVGQSRVEQSREEQSKAEQSRALYDLERDQYYFLSFRDKRFQRQGILETRDFQRQGVKLGLVVYYFLVVKAKICQISHLPTVAEEPPQSCSSLMLSSSSIFLSI